MFAIQATSSAAPIYEKFEGVDITDEILEQAASLFSANYGVWGPLAESKMGSFAKQGRRIRMSPQRLRHECLPKNASNTYIRAMSDGRLAGNVFATRWKYEGSNMCWITQLCVNSAYRRAGLATNLIHEIQKGEDDCVFGILSSHPAAIRAVLRACGRSLGEVDMAMISDYGPAIMETCPVSYVKQAQMHGSIFGEEEEKEVMCCANTNFWVDHNEPLAALAVVKEQGLVWPLGKLPESHEFVMLVKIEDLHLSL